MLKIKIIQSAFEAGACFLCRLYGFGEACHRIPGFLGEAEILKPAEVSSAVRHTVETALKNYMED